jgi:DNA repair exonuclease SbcCD ATPase subunit
MKGFMRFKSLTTIKLNDGITVIYGKNGAGKTSIIDAIFFCLYGKTLRTTGTGSTGFLSLKDLINKEAQEAEVEVSFSINEKEYIVTRKISKTGNTIVYIKTDNTQIAEGANVAKMLGEQIIGLNYNGLKDSIMIMQGEMDKYLEMTSSERKNTLVDLFKINEYSIYNKKLKEIIRDWSDKLIENKSKLELLEDEIKKEKDIETELKSITDITNDVTKNIDEKQNNITALEEKKQELEETKNKDSFDIKLANQQIIALNNNIKVFNDNAQKLDGKTKCPLCLQTIEHNEKIINHYSDEIEKANIEIEKIKTEISTKTINIKHQEETISELTDTILKLKTEIKSTLQQQQQKEAQTISLKNKLKELTEMKAATNSIEKEINKISQKNDAGLLLQNAYDEIPKRILTRLLPSIEKEASNIISLISENYISFIKIEQKTFKIQPFINGRFEEIQFLSGGEKVKVAIAIRIAISNIISKLSALTTLKTFTGLKTLIIDEGDFGSLDDDGINNIINIIQNLKSVFQKIIIITHINDLKEALPDNLINVTKSENKYESKISYEYKEI